MSGYELRLEIDDTDLYDGAPTPANGDPYVAVVMQTNENGAAVQQETLTLGTGFESIDDIAWELKRQLADPERYGHDIEFVPDRADIFGIAGAVDFA
jgi:hypothetical protein